MKFYSKHDIWLGLILYLPSLFAIIEMYRGEGFTGFTLLILGVLILITWIWIGTYYVIEEGMLIVRCGPSLGRYPIAEMRKIKASKSWLSSPACSLDRILIVGDTFNLLISPKKKTEFIDALREENSLIIVEEV